jgi:hypothetical protein
MAGTSRRALRHRLEAHSRFDRWVAAHPTHLSPEAAVAAAGQLYELLPVTSRHRMVDPTGVMTLHRLLRRAARSI